MDNFFTGSHANVAHHLGKPNFELLRHDIVEPILLEARPLGSACCALRCHAARVLPTRRRRAGQQEQAGRRWAPRGAFLGARLRVARFLPR
jgi:hypothetical protein